MTEPVGAARSGQAKPSQPGTVLLGGLAGLAYGGVLSLLSLGAAGAGNGTFIPAGLSSAPVGFFGVVPALIAAPFLWAAFGALAAAAGLGRLERSAILLPALHDASVLVLIQIGEYGGARKMRDAFVQAPWFMAAWVVVYVAGQVALWRRLRASLRRTVQQWIAIGDLRNRKLFVAAWLLFLASLFLPADLTPVDRSSQSADPWIAGWQMAWLAGWFFITLLGAPPTEAYFAWYPAALLSGNVFMLWSAYSVLRRGRCGSKWMLFGSIGATIVACTPGLGLMPGRMGEFHPMRLGPGYYAWVASLVCLCAGVAKSATWKRTFPPPVDLP